LGRKSGIPPATANGILKRLTSQGYFASSLDDGLGKGHAVHYRAIPPEDAFRNFHKDYERFTEDLDVLSEQLENVSESDDRSSEMYLLRTKESAIIRVAKHLLGKENVFTLPVNMTSFPMSKTVKMNFEKSQIL